MLITLLVSGTSASDVNSSSVAIGGALSMVDGSAGSTGPFRSRTSIDTVAVSVLPFSSATVYSKVSSPLNPEAGVYS